jgi:hypothetical protein
VPPQVEVPPQQTGRTQSAGRPRTARERAERAAQERAAAQAGNLPQAPPSDDPTIAISVDAVRAAAAAKDGPDTEQTQVIEWPAAGAPNPEDESVRTQVLPTTEPEQAPEQPPPPRKATRRRRNQT